MRWYISHSPLSSAWLWENNNSNKSQLASQCFAPWRCSVRMKSLFTCNAFHGRQLHSRYISFVRDVNQVKNTPLLEVLGEKVCCNCIGSTRNALSDTFCGCQLGGRHIDFGIRAAIEKKRTIAEAYSFACDVLPWGQTNKGALIYVVRCTSDMKF